MNKKIHLSALSIIGILSFALAFSVFPKQSLAILEDPSDPTNLYNTSETSAPEEESNTDATTASPSGLKQSVNKDANALRQKQIQQSLQLKETSLQNGIANIDEMTQINQDRVLQFKQIQEERRQKFEEIKTNYLKNKEEFQAKKTEMKDQALVKKIEKFNKRISLTEARLNKTFEHLYSVSERVSGHLKEQQDAGFDTADQQAKLETIVTSISNAETTANAMIEKYRTAVQDPTTLSLEQLQQLNEDFKNEIMNLISNLKEIKSQMLTLISQVK